MSEKFDILFFHLSWTVKALDSKEYKKKLKEALESCKPSKKGIKEFRKALIKISFNRAKLALKKKKSEE
ncbi:hypothetical protein HF1_14920 [Mycoplasma haemofelis str. Langford 1]|uniref:Uncharacterized protein n=1 Tax=Mycoplasma haemofelis (strain Langford 1) TaxID=941640 RepID=E8ZK29_MYCHL|nr:hypothetical protein [Mycoplasma haemofelis]CBY93500.1 hypothetical protein HF1_14920 [Mycoplasma haemofelis str. Langford 1]